MAWFCGIEMAPLIERIQPGSTPAALLSKWSQRMPPHVAHILVEMLIKKRVLVRDAALVDRDQVAPPGLL
jgi:hypothetical protein